ncbi:heme-binding protein [Mycobacterium sp. CVI_P3]|uniref:Heme-binding protein n=1 Tax=Mycobacterium pinniadriaticum TaxID=2994102 RepID=A0ABT3SG65_9MYCO|nr:heme-binding protein [Mycobacterium pinniadriaticum]MCX2932062.1 heme-binding protein [Mycobacterium pinniadriaticum]MCX2938486.1 heme-binding protein [Mycobacterium pinniadriaticum]
MTIDTRRLVAWLAGFGAIAIGMFGQIPSAAADPNPNPQPNCTAADMEGVRMGVQAATSAYLFTHPDVNAFFTGLAGVPRAQVLAKVKDYLAANPQTAADITGIRQPLLDIKTRCGQLPGSAV